MAQRTAERHTVRLKAIQEAQEAQLREDEAARVAAAAAASASVPLAPPEAPQAAAAETTDSQEDEYHFPSDDDALYATVDLDGLDDGVGRPIDFEEGAGAATEDSTTSSVGSTAAVDVPMRDSAQPARPNWLQANGSSGNAQRAPAAQHSSASTSISAGARPQTSHPNVAQSRSGSSSSSSANGERARTPSMGGGFSFPIAVSGVVSFRIYPVNVVPVDSSNSNTAAGSLRCVLMALPTV